MLMENHFNSITLLSDGYTYDTTTSRFIAGFAIILIIGDIAQWNSIQTVLLQEIKEKLFGKRVQTRGTVMLVHSCNTAKAAGIDPIVVSKNMHIQSVYTSRHQIEVSKEIAELIEK